MKRVLLVLAVLLGLGTTTALAAQADLNCYNPVSKKFEVCPAAVAKFNYSLQITTGNTFQSALGAGSTRRSLEIQNNITANTHNCWVNDDTSVAVGNTTATTVTTNGGAGSVPAAVASILLAPGQAYTRYFPFVPNGPVVVTCEGTGDSLYVSVQ